ncbi:MAG: 4-hydroxy-tetrahydrodipicolinate synthase [Acidobacteriota bacterium]
MQPEQLRGTTVALVTPFRADGALDEPAVRSLVEWQIASGVEAILVAGTTGEGATLAAEEHARLVEVAVEAAAGRRPVLAGTGSNDTKKAVALSRQAVRCGCDAVLVVAPYYNKPTQEGLYQHFRAVAEAVEVPVLLYNVPGRTASNIAAETVLRLAEVPNIIGVKEASGNFVQVMEILRGRPDGFLVLSGDDALTLPLVALGADGVIAVVANEVPAEFAEMVRAALRGDWQEARRIHYRLLPLMLANFRESNPIPVKAALALMGKIEEHLRLPLVPASENTRREMREILEDLGVV